MSYTHHSCWWEAVPTICRDGGHRTCDIIDLCLWLSRTHHHYVPLVKANFLSVLFPDITEVWFITKEALFRNWVEPQSWGQRMNLTLTLKREVQAHSWRKKDLSKWPSDSWGKVNGLEDGKSRELGSRKLEVEMREGCIYREERDSCPPRQMLGKISSLLSTRTHWLHFLASGSQVSPDGTGVEWSWNITLRP